MKTLDDLQQLAAQLETDALNVAAACENEVTLSDAAEALVNLRANAVRLSQDLADVRHRLAVEQKESRS
jgi:hypothetical protein